MFGITRILSVGVYAFVVIALTRVEVGDAIGQTVHFQKDGVARSDSWLKWKGTLHDDSSSLTICLRIFLLQTRETNYVVSYAVEDDFNELFIDIRYNQQDVRIGCCNDEMYETFQVIIPLMTWNHMCFIMDLLEATLLFHYNNETAKTRDLGPSKIVRREGLLMLGQDQDTFGGGTEATQSLNAYLSDFFLANETAAPWEVKNYMTCSESKNNSKIIVDFNDVKQDFEFGAATLITDLGYTNACTGLGIFPVLFPEVRNLADSQLLCKRLRSSLILPQSLLQNVAVTVLCKKFCDVGRIWLGAEKTDADTREYETSFPINYTAWDRDIIYSGVPMHVILFSKTNAWDSNWGITTAERQLCTMCSKREPFSIKVRGFCKETRFDRQYIIHGYANQKPVFVGTKSSNISWIAYNMTQDKFSGYWRLILSEMPDIKAEMMMESRDSYPMGTHSWKVRGDTCNRKNIRLKFTTCPEGMFTCDDGSCINKTLRCDKKVDCRDFSDELRCNLVLQPQGYDGKIPPPFSNNNFPVKIPISVDFKFIRTIDISRFSLSLDVRLMFRWRDSRLQFRNLRKKMSYNVIEDLGEAWVPDLILTGADELIAQMELRKENNFVDRLASPKPDDSTKLDEDFLYDGEENAMVGIREWTLKIVCHYDLSAYPFDTQRCPMSIILEKYTSDIFVVVINSINLPEHKRHHEYRLKNILLSNFTTSDENSGQRLELVLCNQYIYYISAAYVPSCMLNIISYMTFYFDVTDFSNRIAVSLTSLLVLATLFSDLAGGLPKTSYLKLIDVWLLGCIAANFCMVAFLVFIEKQRQQQHYQLQQLEQQTNPVEFGKMQPLKSDSKTRVSAISGNWSSYSTHKQNKDKVIISSKKIPHELDVERLEEEEEKTKYQIEIRNKFGFSNLTESCKKISLNTVVKISIPIALFIFISAYIGIVLSVLHN